MANTVIFNGVEYQQLRAGGYYISRSKSNAGRKRAKGLHVAIWEHENGRTVPKGFVVHHIDGDRDNNHPANLECLSRREHAAKHIEIYRTPERLAHFSRIRKQAAAWHSSPEGIAWHKEHALKMGDKLRPKIEHKCQQCGSVFAARPGAKFCHYRCGLKWAYHNKPKPMSCAICGDEFQSKGHRRRTCSNECRTALRLQSHS